MAQLLDIFGFLSVVLRGLNLSFQSLIIGGLVFDLIAHAAASGSKHISAACRRMIVWSAFALLISQSAFLAANAAILIETTGMPFSGVVGADFFIAGAASILIAAAVILSQLKTIRSLLLMLIISTGLLASSVVTSHAAGRVDDRTLPLIFTALHQAATATWIGGLPYFLICLALSKHVAEAQALSRRFSRLAQISVAVLLTAGAGLAWLYVDTPSALIGTSYGVMVSAKIVLLCLLLVLGASNFFIVRRLKAGDTTPLMRLRRFSEAEIGIGFTVLLVAGSLTSQPPAIDVLSTQPSMAEIIQRLTPMPPRLTTPPPGEVYNSATPAPDSSDRGLESFVPGQLSTPITSEEIALSEFNHHWAGIFVLCAGLMAVFARAGIAWLRHWPWVFFLLGIFVLLMADADYWPVGHIPFWRGFMDSEVLQHRLVLPLLGAFAWFEWKVQTGRAQSPRAALVFPIVCALGGAILLTHTHSLNNVKEELFAEISHIPIAIASIIAGWSRWLELRLQDGPRRILSWVWPVCLVFIGVWLLNYRES
ncbi:MAG: copper resistance protein [Acidobacteria bacterium]|nr:copper resistance protein [Acidobacteriota bacterium]